MKTNYSDIPISEKQSEGMTLTSDDRQYLERMFCRQDEASEKLLADTLNIRDKELCTALAEVVSEQNKLIFRELEKQTKSIERISKIISNHEKRLHRLEIKLNQHIKEHHIRA